MTAIILDKALVRDRVGDPKPKLIAFALGIFITCGVIITMLALVVVTQHSNALWAVLPLAFVTIGICQYILAQGAHEAAHFYLKRKSTSSQLVAIFLFYAIGMTPDYQRTHMAHHTHFGDPDKDPDYPVYMRAPRSKFAFLLMMCMSLTGVSALQRFVQLNRDDGKPAKAAAANDYTAKLVLTQLVIMAAFMLAFASVWLGPVFYVLLWVLPVVTVVKTMVDIRVFAEHGGADRPALRSFTSKDLITRLFGVYGFDHHAEHHLYAQYPCTQLASVAGCAHASNQPATGNEVEVEYLAENHLQFIWRYFSALPKQVL